MIGAAADGAPAIVLIGGRAQRLRSVLRCRPKALIPFCGTPFLELLLRKLRHDGFANLVLVSDRPRREVHDLLASHRAELGDPTIVYSQEGTAPAVLAGLEAIQSPAALCLNGDTMLDIDYSTVLEDHDRSSQAVTLVTSARSDAPNGGAVRVAADGCVIGFAEGPRAREHAARAAAWRFGRDRADRFESNCGCYAVDTAELISELRARGDQSFEHETLPRLAAAGMAAATPAGSRFFLDFGTPDRLSRAASSTELLREIYRL